jgi:hypothetical protein
MAKFSTFPTLYDNVLQLQMSKLVSFGYLQPDQRIDTNLVWSSGGEKRGEISMMVDTRSETPFIELDYKFQDQPRKYRINIVSINSNLGKGLIYYFVCPHTNRRCRTLYSISGYFYHRRAFNGCMYECQTLSKRIRSLTSLYGFAFADDSINEQLYKKNFKKTYAGKPTKRYIKLSKQLERIDRSYKNYHEFERLLCK